MTHISLHNNGLCAALLGTLLLMACHTPQTTHCGDGRNLEVGDLLFYTDTTGMGAAVSESTGRYTHVAMVAEVADTVWIIDATQRYGVSRRPLLRTVGDARPMPDVYRLTCPFDTAATVARAMLRVGLPYDDAFLPHNGALYCSELIYECYIDSSGTPLFHQHPMNWRNPKGELPQYWTDHFKSIGMPVPEGVEGTNPTDMSREPLLQKI